MSEASGSSASWTTPPTRIAMIAMGRYGGFELSYGSDADVLFVHEPEDGRRPARRPRRTPRPSPRRYAVCSRSPAATRRSSSTPTCAPRASRDRWSGPSTPTPPTTRSGRRSGRRRRCCGPTRSSVTPDLRGRFTALIDPLRYPGGRPRRGRHRRGPPDQGAGRQRAAAARRGPVIPLQARPRRAGGHRVDGAAAAAAARRRDPRPAHHPDPGRAGRGDRGRPARRATTQTCWRRAGARSAGCATRPRWPAESRSTRCRVRRANAVLWQGFWAIRSDQSDAMVNDYLRVTRRARAVVDRVFWE